MAAQRLRHQLVEPVEP
ncbi:hypothetical protein ACE1BO_14165 [Aeromonas veronii]